MVEREGTLLEAAKDHVYLRNNHALEGLTGAQYQFAVAVFNGATHTEAYRRIYDTSGMNEDTVNWRARDVAGHPRVKAKIESLRVETDKVTTLVPSLSRDWILNGIMDIASEGDKDSTRLAAFALLGKVAGIDLFRDVKVTQTESRSVEEIEKELTTRLRALADVSKLIDGEARRPGVLPVATSPPRSQPRPANPVAPRLDQLEAAGQRAARNKTAPVNDRRRKPGK